MKTIKKHPWITIFILLLTVGFIMVDSFIYTKKKIEVGSYPSILKEYKLNIEEEYRLFMYEKSTLFNRKEPMLYILTGSKQLNSEVILSATTGNEFIELSLPHESGTGPLAPTIRIQQEIQWKNIHVTVQVGSYFSLGIEPLEADEYYAEYLLLVEKDDILYRIIFDNNMDSPIYKLEETEIHQEDLEKCLDYLDEIFE